MTRTQAEAELRRLIDQQAPVVRGERLSLREAGERLVADLEMRGRKTSTLAAHESNLRAQLVPFFGHRPLAKIEVEDVEQFVAARWHRSAAKSIRNYLGTLHSVFDFCGIEPNPVASARRPAAEERDADIRFLTEAEVEALLRATPEDELGRTDHSLI